MVKVKKRASKRVGTAQREKIKRKINEHHRKSRKTAKKDVTWKSKLKKDPGIPNSYPFKEQLLNEIERKREAEEMEKIRLKEEKNNLKKNKKAGGKDDGDEDDDEDEEEDGGEGSVFPDDGGLEQTNIIADSKLEDVPAVVMYQDSLDDLIKDEDVHTLVHVLDARDPIISLVPKLIQVSKQNGKNFLVALTRSELVPLESLSNLVTHLSNQSELSPEQFFPLVLPPPAATNQKSMAEHLSACGDFPGVEALVERIRELTVTRLENMKKKSKGGEDEGDLEVGAVAVVGVENSGRTSVANSISSCLNNASEEDASPIDDLLVFDTPSILSPHKPLLQDENEEEEEEVDQEAKAEHDQTRLEIESLRILMRNQGSLNKIKDPLPLVSQIISRLNNPTDLMLLYNTPAFGSFSQTVANSSKEAKREEVEKNLKEFLIGLARNRGKMSGKGVPDWWGSSRILLKDWSDGTIGYYTNLSNPDEGFKSQSKELREQLMQHDELKDKLLSRKEWRKSEVGKKELRLKAVEDDEEKPMTSRSGDRIEIYFRKLRDDEILAASDDEDEEGWEESEMLDGEEDDDEEEEEEMDEAEDEIEVDQEEAEEANTSALKSILKPSAKKTAKKPSNSKNEVKPKKSVTLGGASSSTGKPVKNPPKVVKVEEKVEVKKPVSKKEKRKSEAQVEKVQEPVTKKAKGSKTEKVVSAKSKVTSNRASKKKTVEVKTTNAAPETKGPAPGEKYDLAQFF